MTPKEAAANHDRHDGKTIQTIGQVTAFTGSDDDEASEHDEKEAKVQQHILEERECDGGAEHGAFGALAIETRIMNIDGDTGDQELDGQTRLAGEALVGLLCHLR